MLAVFDAWPWQHAALTLKFEKALQAVDPRVTVPYWDYTVDSHYIADNYDGQFSKHWFDSDVSRPPPCAPHPRLCTNPAVTMALHAGWPADGYDHGACSFAEQVFADDIFGRADPDEHFISTGRWAKLEVRKSSANNVSAGPTRLRRHDCQ